MKFKNITIPAEGRNKYGNYMSSSELQKSVVRVTYNGNNTTGGNDTKKPEEEQKDVYTLFLSRSTIKFDSKKLLDGNVTESIDVLGFVNSFTGDTFVGIIDEIPTEDIEKNNDYYDIVGAAEKGMTISVANNGTKNTQIQITCTSAATENKVMAGTLVVPCSVYKKSGDVSLGPYLTDWASEKDNCYTLYLEIQWEISALPASNAYTLELTNEIAGINCDSKGNIYPNAVRPTCKAIMYYGTEEVANATYSISIDENRNAQGVTINTATGELTFGSNFTFDGTTLEVKVTGNANGALQSKIMTIVKQYPGADGTPATTRWVVPSVNTIKFNPNTNVMTPSSVSCKVMKQVGEEAPVEDNDTTIYYGYNTTNPLTPYTGPVSPDASKDYMVFALKNNNNDVYEIETIQIIKEGINGDNGESVYRLTLTNENASINADSEGNIYPNANRPTCTATLYYGTTKVSDATYSITTNPTSTGVTINSTTGVITFDSTFNFGGTSLEITVTAMVGSVIFGTAIMTVSKSMAGNNGEDSVSYWLDLSTTAVVVAKGATAATPDSVTLKAFKQIGGNSPTEITSTGVIKWGYSTPVPQRTETTISNIDTASTYIMVHLIVDNVIYDRQTIAIIKDGADGEVGPQGRQGAAIRGPIDWKNQTTSRRWCNGTLTNASYPEDAEFIDIVVFNGVYYKCKTSYEGAGSETTAPSSTYWVATDKQYEFVATNLLMAENAKINFQTSNELYLMDSYGNVTAGAAGGDSINFWAGANEPKNGSFKVYNNGTMEATKGKFGVLEIGSDQWGKGKLYGTSTQSDGSLNNISVQPELFKMEGADQNGKVLESVMIAPYRDPDKYDLNGVITVETYYATDNGLYTTGMVEAEGFTKSINSHIAFSPFSPVNNLEITFVTDTNYFTKSNGYWVWKGMYLNKVSTSTYPYVVKGSNGEWCFSTTQTQGAYDFVGSGIYTSDHIKQNNRLYIVI